MAKGKSGRPPSFEKGGKMVKCTITRNLPEKGKETIIEAINKTIDQFKPYDWT